MYQVGSACYDTLLQAAQAQASTVVGSVVAHGSAAYVVGVSAVSDASITYSLTPFGGGAQLVLEVPNQAQPCGMLMGADGLQIGWMVAAAWIAAYAISFLKRAIPSEERNGDA